MRNVTAEVVVDTVYSTDEMGRGWGHADRNMMYHETRRC